MVTVAVRAALIFGNIQPGDLAGLLKYTAERVPAFVNTFGAIDAVVVSAGAGAIALGFPVVVDIDLGENQVPGALESVCDHAETVKKSLELRSIKIKVKELPIPVPFAAAFEGEIIRMQKFSFEYDKEFLQSEFVGTFFDYDLQLYSGRQYLPTEKSLFGVFSDTAPDRWGRLLMKRRERIAANEEGRSTV